MHQALHLRRSIHRNALAMYPTKQHDPLFHFANWLLSLLVALHVDERSPLKSCTVLATVRALPIQEVNL